MADEKIEGTPPEGTQPAEIDYSKLDLDKAFKDNVEFQKRFDQKVSEGIKTFETNQAKKQEDIEKAKQAAADKAALDAADKKQKEAMAEAPAWAKEISDSVNKTIERMNAMDQEKVQAQERKALDLACKNAGLPEFLWPKVASADDIEPMKQFMRDAAKQANKGGDFNLPGDDKGKQERLTPAQLEHCKQNDIKPEDYLTARKRLKDEEREPVEKLEPQTPSQGV